MSRHWIRPAIRLLAAISLVLVAASTSAQINDVLVSGGTASHSEQLRPYRNEPSTKRQLTDEGQHGSDSPRIGSKYVERSRDKPKVDPRGGPDH